MEPTRWFILECEKLWPGAVRVSWERYRSRDFVVPVYGAGFYRETDEKTGEVRIRVHTDDASMAGAWVKPEKAQPGARYVLREKSRKGRTYKIFDCVTEDGQLVPLSQYVLDALKRRYDAMSELERQWDEFENAEKVEGPDGRELTLNARQVQKRKEFADEAHDTFMELAEGLAGVERIYMGGHDPKAPGSGFSVVDKRRLRASDVGDSPHQD